MASDDNWYRSSDWSKAAQDLFYEKLSRSRGNYYRQQYARIKALSLIGTKKDNLLHAAVMLLLRSIEEWCEYQTEYDEAYATLGEAYRLLGDIPSAIVAYEKSISWNLSLVHRGYWDYPEMIVSEGLEDRYDRALAIVSRLHKADDDLMMETDKFIYHAVRAVVFKHQGKDHAASEDARKALILTSVGKSMFRYHPEVGLVDKHKYMQLIKKLEPIAS